MLLEVGVERYPEHGNKKSFGHAIGTTLGGVVAYSSDYESADKSQFPSRASYISYHDGIYTGFKYQCVEFARRWLVATKGISFPDVGMAYEIFDLSAFERVSDHSPVLVTRHQNGGTTQPPMIGAVMLWKPEGYFRHTGHVAIVVGVTAKTVEVAEQNVYDQEWPEGRHYSRSLPLDVNADSGSVFVHDNHHDSFVMGWIEYVG